MPDYGGRVKNIKYYSFDNECYNKEYKRCYEAATNLINNSLSFSNLNPEEIMKAFANMEFRNNEILFDAEKTQAYYDGILSNYFQILKLFGELLKINKEMLVALIRAINDNKIKYDCIHYFIDDEGILGARRCSNNDDKIISMYCTLLEYNDFNLDNLNLGDLVTKIRPPLTKNVV